MKKQPTQIKDAMRLCTLIKNLENLKSSLQFIDKHIKNIRRYF